MVFQHSRQSDTPGTRRASARAAGAGSYFDLSASGGFDIRYLIFLSAYFEHKQLA